MPPADWVLGQSLRLAGGEAGVLREMGMGRQRATSYQWPAKPWDVLGLAMLPYRLFMHQRGRANDGCVPVSSQIL